MRLNIFCCLYKASMRVHGYRTFFPSFLPSTFVFQWFGVPTTHSTQTRISPLQMCGFRAMAVWYRKKNTTLRYRPRLKKYQTKIQMTAILTVASQHGLSLLVFVSCFLLCLHNLIIPFVPFLRQCVIYAQHKYFNQLVHFSLFFIIHIPRKQKSRAFTIIFHTSPDFISLFWSGLAMLIHGAWVMSLQIQLGRNWFRKYRFFKTIIIPHY